MSHPCKIKESIVCESSDVIGCGSRLKNKSIKLANECSKDEINRYVTYYEEL